MTDYGAYVNSENERLNDLPFTMDGRNYTAEQARQLHNLSSQIDAAEKKHDDDRLVRLYGERNDLLGKPSNYSVGYLQLVNSGMYGDDARAYLDREIRQRLPGDDISYVHPEIVLDPTHDPTDNWMHLRNLYPYLLIFGGIFFVLSRRKK